VNGNELAAPHWVPFGLWATVSSLSHDSEWRNNIGHPYSASWKAAAATARSESMTGVQYLDPVWGYGIVGIRALGTTTVTSTSTAGRDEHDDPLVRLHHPDLPWQLQKDGDSVKPRRKDPNNQSSDAAEKWSGSQAAPPRNIHLIFSSPPGTSAINAYDCAVRSVPVMPPRESQPQTADAPHRRSGDGSSLLS
jgi:hypothetical protein